ncbi:MAG: histidinol-phosphate transaminase [Actinomycetota bacterium]|nr:histidinol-phosphate transaminase [Actinomycetota bacterium]MDQ3575250.1 histidinol-phosphate transaminase [Actinomycetota bacterium]
MGALIPPSDDQGLGAGYHSPQVVVNVRLNTNESPYPPPPAFVDALATELSVIAFNRYPDREASALRTSLGQLHGVGPEHVFVANGSNEVLQTLLVTYGGPGRHAAVFEPTYALHSHLTRLTRTGLWVGERQPDFSLDVGEVKRAAAEADPAVTFVCSPNNPTGGAEPASVVEEVLDLAPGLVVVDEAYGQFAPWSAMALVADDMGLVVVRTYSKTWSMAAARLGYLVGPASVVAEMERRALPYHLDAVKQAAGRLALRFTAEMEARVAAVKDERERVLGALRELAVETWPSDANFVLMRPTARDSGEVWAGLVERSVLVRDVGGRPRLAGCLRVTVGTPAENDAFVAALAEVLEAA